MKDNMHIFSEDDPLYGTWKDDWRLTNGYNGASVEGLHFQHRLFDRTICIEDFDECAYCYKQFDADEQHPLSAYYCRKKPFWVCETCFSDFKAHFGWTAEELNEEPLLDPLSRLTAAFWTIVDTDPRVIVVCDCQHQVRYMNEAAKAFFSNTDILGHWWGSAFENAKEEWPTIQNSFIKLFQSTDQSVAPAFKLGDTRFEMTVLRNRHNELMGYSLSIEETT